MLKELADAVEMYEDTMTLRSRKCNISQVSPSEQGLPGPQARSQFLSHGTCLVQQQHESTPNSLHLAKGHGPIQGRAQVKWQLSQASAAHFIA